MGEQRVEGAARLERPRMLEKFELEAHRPLMAERVREVQNRRAPDMGGNAGMSGFEGRAGERRHETSTLVGPDRDGKAVRIPLGRVRKGLAPSLGDLARHHK